MAVQYVGLNRGQHDVDVVAASTDQSKSLQLKIDLAANMSREEVIRMLQYIEMYLVRHEWPLA